MSPLTLSHTNGSQISPSMDARSGDNQSNHAWLQSSVTEFFSAINWDDKPPEVYAATLPSRDAAAESLSLEMSVTRFFGSFNWDGIAIAAPAPTLPTPEAKPKKNFTLDEFSDLF